MRNKLVSLLVLAGTVFAQGQLYNVNFNAPAQPVDSVVVTGPAPQFVTSIFAGSPAARSSFNGLTDQPLVLQPDDQIELDLRSFAKSFVLSFDFSSTDMIGLPGATGLTVYFDTGFLNNLYFHS